MRTANATDDAVAAVDDPWSAALAEIAEPDAVARFVLNAEHHAVPPRGLW